ncbi:hypothetical protein Tco_0013237 [Tanacetum coccineum]
MSNSRRIQTVTYKGGIYSFMDLVDIGSPGVDGLPMMLEDPYVEAALQAPPYPDYVPKDDVLPAEEQPLPAAVSPTIDSPGDDDKDDDDDVEEDEDKDEEEAEEGHPASANSIPPPVHRVIARMSIRDQPPTPFWSKAEIDRLLAIPSPPPSPLSPLSSPLS